MFDINISVSKRDGTIIAYDLSRIEKAVMQALISTEEIPYNQMSITAQRAAALTERQLLKSHGTDDNIIISVEEIQDAVEETLMRMELTKTAKAYILYRKQHEKVRENKSTLLDVKDQIESFIGPVKDWRVKENSTVTTTLGGLILSNSGAMTANYWLNEIYDEDVRNAHINADIHIHDLSMLSGYCAGWSLKQLIERGIMGVEGRIASAPAKHLSTLCNQMVNFLGILQNEWAGAQAFSSFDTYLAPFVRTGKLSYKETKQCIQSFIYGTNTPSRWGCVEMDTRVMTPTGWKKFDELKIGDTIYTWLNGTLHEAPLKHLIHRKNDYGVLHRYSGVSYRQTVTPEHRCLIESGGYRGNFIIRQSMDIFNKRKDTRMPTCILDTDIHATTVLSDEEVMFAAMYYADGTASLDGDIQLFKSARRDDGTITSVLDALGLDYSKYEQPRNNSIYHRYHILSKHRDYVRNLIGQKYDIDDKFLHLPSDQSELFIKTWAAFDGSINERLMCQYDNEDIREKLEIIMIRAGYMPHKWSRKKPADKNPTNYLYAERKHAVVVAEQEEIPYNGMVWCPSTEDGTAIFKDAEGYIFISGNCQPPFTNVTLDWVCPPDMVNMPAIVGGKEMDFTYGDCKKEMDMVNKAFIEVMIEGDADGRGFQYPIPTYSITKDFDWSDTENNRLLFEMTAKYGTPYFSNYINSDMEPSDVRSMCCRLRLELRELRKRNGGFFGSGESTGSVGVVTINMPRLAYQSKTEEEFFFRLTRLMDICARSLDTKRTVITRLMDEGMYPYTRAYLGSFDNHFSTIGLVGMNEAALNAGWLHCNLTDPRGHDFAKRVLDYMREKLADYQEMYPGTLFNLEATPAESTTYRFAKHDVKDFPDIITAAKDDETPFYTNSSHIPVDSTDDIFDALDLQDELQTKYTSGTVFHAFLGERLPDWQSAANLVRKIAENYKLPYYTMSPTYSVCADHGYIRGEHFTCPTCGKETEVYSRITGYYRPLQNWNDGKAQEFKSRKEYDAFKTGCMVAPADECASCGIDPEPQPEFECATCGIDYPPEVGNEPDGDTPKATVEPGTVSVMTLVTTPTCPNCKLASRFLEENGHVFEKIYANEHPDVVARYNIMTAPTLLVPSDNGTDVVSNASNIRAWALSHGKA